MKSLLGKVIIVLLLMNIICIPNITYAMDDVISHGDSFIGAADTDLPINTNALHTTSNDIYNILFTIAVVLAVAVGMMIGIQFMIGSVEEQAKVKETLVPYIIGVFVVFASFTIWKIAVNIGNDVAPTISNSGTANEDNLIKRWNENNISQKLMLYKAEVDKNSPYSEQYRLDYAIKKLSKEEKEIYYECKNAGLLDQTGMFLNNVVN